MGAEEDAIINMGGQEDDSTLFWSIAIGVGCFLLLCLLLIILYIRRKQRLDAPEPEQSYTGMSDDSEFEEFLLGAGTAAKD